MITEEDLKDLPQTLELLEGRILNVVVEGRPPTCYGRGQKEPIRKRRPLNIVTEEQLTSAKVKAEKNARKRISGERK